MKKRWIKKVPVVIAIASLGIFVFSEVVMLLWNNILTATLHVGAITFWQAAGILLLSKILFGGFRGKRMMGCGWRKRAMYAHWQKMTPEQQEQFKEYKCC